MNSRFVFFSKSEVDNYQKDIMMMESIEPTRDQWIPFRTIWDRIFDNRSYPAHLSEITADIIVAWTDYIDEVLRK